MFSGEIKETHTNFCPEIGGSSSQRSMYLGFSLPLSKIFFSYNVGNLDKFKGGIVHYSLKQLIFNIRSLYANKFFLQKLEDAALKDYKVNYSENNIKDSFEKILNIKL